jgi:hypothetical protein
MIKKDGFEEDDVRAVPTGRRVSRWW